MLRTADGKKQEEDHLSVEINDCCKCKVAQSFRCSHEGRRTRRVVWTALGGHDSSLKSNKIMNFCNILHYVITVYVTAAAGNVFRSSAQ